MLQRWKVFFARCRRTAVFALMCLHGACLVAGCAGPPAADQTWYCGSREGWNYFHVDGPGKNFNYRLPADQVKIPQPFDLTTRRELWKPVEWDAVKNDSAPSSPPK